MSLFAMVLTVHVLVAAFMIGLILIQHGKGADAGAAFGSGASGTVFGSKGSSSFLTRTTAILAAAFFVTSLTLAYLGGNRAAPNDIINQISAPQAAQSSEATPADLINNQSNGSANGVSESPEEGVQSNDISIPD